MRSPGKAGLALAALAVLVLALSACGGSVKGRSVSASARVGQAQTTIGTVAEQSAPPEHGAAALYDNDGDNDPSNDNDPDNNKPDDDNDAWEDNTHPENDKYHDKDDVAALAYGRSADADTARAITGVVKDYYAAAVMGSGARACSMMQPSFEKAVAEDYGRAPGPEYLRGAKTCESTMILLFRHLHDRLTTAFHVTEVRVSGDLALAMFGSRHSPASEISLELVGRHWTVDTAIGTPMS